MSAKKKILIIEDEEALLLAMSEEFKRAGFEPHAAVGGEEGLRLVREVKPEIILLDLLLPGMNGIQFLKKIKSQSELAEIPVLVLTNLSDEKTVAEVLSAGGTDYLVKADVDLESVVDKVNQILTRKKLLN